MGDKKAEMTGEVRAKLRKASADAVVRGQQSYAEAFAALAGDTLDESKPVRMSKQGRAPLAA